MRPTWKGFLKISLVTIPIKVYPATEAAATISFNQLHENCGTRIQQKKWCPRCEKEILSSEIVKGYEVERGHYVLLDETDFEAVVVPSTKVIDLVQFTGDRSIDPLYVDRTYHLAPDGPMAADAYAVMAAAMGAKVGIGRLAIYGREYLVAVRAVVGRLLLHTLHHAAEIRSPEAIDEVRAVPRVVDVDQIRLARQVIAAFERPLDLTAFTDGYQTKLREIIDAKIAGQAIQVAPVATPPVVNLAEALKASLERVSAGKKRPAKATRDKKRQTA
jgi:DNA end-binding protein Ku